MVELCNHNECAIQSQKGSRSLSETWCKDETLQPGRGATAERAIKGGACKMHLENLSITAIIRNGFMPHIMGHKLAHIYAREVR